jgi:hypothetical protein
LRLVKHSGCPIHADEDCQRRNIHDACSLAHPTLPGVPGGTNDDFSQSHPERHPIYRRNIVRLQQLLF